MATLPRAAARRRAEAAGYAKVNRAGLAQFAMKTRSDKFLWILIHRDIPGGVYCARLARLLERFWAHFVAVGPPTFGAPRTRR